MFEIVDDNNSNYKVSQLLASQQVQQHQDRSPKAPIIFLVAGINLLLVMLATEKRAFVYYTFTSHMPKEKARKATNVC